MRTVFLHGLESSSRGTKARWFKRHFPAMAIPDFSGTLDERMKKLETILAGREKVILTGSSYGGLMATIYAQENACRVKKVILLAPALNFPEFIPFRERRITVPVMLFIGRHDTVCPPDTVLPIARQICADLSVHLSDDDHFLRATFAVMDWAELLGA